VRVPPLAERREDIPDLVRYFMEQISLATGLPRRLIGEERDGGAAVARLARQRCVSCANNVERLMILAGGDPEAVITASMLPQDVGSMVPSMPNGNGGEQLMGFAAGARRREVFEARISGCPD